MIAPVAMPVTLLTNSTATNSTSTNSESSNTNATVANDNQGQANTTLDGVSQDACKWVCPYGEYQMPGDRKSSYAIAEASGQGLYCKGPDGVSRVGWYRPSRLPKDAKPNEEFRIDSQEALVAFTARGGVYGPRLAKEGGFWWDGDPLEFKGNDRKPEHMFKYRASLQSRNDKPNACPDISLQQNKFMNT
jgi:hypothetical protein